MESEYDRKFEDMKKYIPFLESMIKRLESTSSLSANPRQAQLDKIRSLRDLLLDKKKRMKMENLLKCEQVLINLYAKVEQRDTLPNTKKNTNPDASDSQLEIVRNKLKRVTKIQDEADTLPEIVRASDVEDVCMTGSAEPALFQRRPHKKSPPLLDMSSSSQEKPKTPELNCKRKYTRVLYSPEPDSRNRSVNPDSSLDSALFSRRSPKKSSSSHNKREGKKNSAYKTSSKKTKDLNITLNVPEESLNSLNTKDILSRIITCNDNDVDIETLRGLRTQILSELKHTGANDDISDLILKSYAGKKSITKAKDEIEEGELSDSESEAIESIYGSLVLVDKDNTKNEVKSAPEKDQPRKIQICLVINSKETESSNKISNLNQIIKENCDLEMFSEMESKSEQVDKAGEPTIGVKNTSDVIIIEDDKNTVKEHELSKTKTNLSETGNNDETTNDTIKIISNVVEENDTDTIMKDVINKAASDVEKNEANLRRKDVINKETICEDEASATVEDITSKISNKVVDENESDVNNEDVEFPELSKQNDKKSDTSAQFKANFYKPLLDDENCAPSSTLSANKLDNCSLHLEKPKTSSFDISSIIIDKNECVEIPLLNEPVISNKPVEKDIDSQIDILQALKNEILGDNILSVSNLDVVTPPLHQPKVTKVSHAQGIMTKKRISIEKYKQKTAPLMLGLASNTLTSPLRDENVKKQSLKLTEKECERFNFPVKIDINDDVSSDDEDQKESTMCDKLYENFAPKSPDNDDINFIENTQPVIIPVDPVKAPVVNFKADVDMRTLPLLSPKEAVTGNTFSSSFICQKTNEINKNEKQLDKIGDRSQSPLLDPRMRRDSNQSNKMDSCNLAAMDLDKVSNSVGVSNINYTPNMTPSMTPSSRGFDMTPSRLTDFDVNSPHKHVYAPSFTLFDSRDSKERSILNDGRSPQDSEVSTGRRSRWEDNDYETSTQRSRYGDTYKPDKNTGQKADRAATDKNDDSLRGHGTVTTLPPFGWSEGPSKPTPFGRSDGLVPLMTLNFGRSDCPSTPSHPFGRADCPPTRGPYSRMDMPGTPSHPFGRTDRPTTPIHSYGRTDCPATPSHPFGMSDVPSTPSSMLGRTDCPATPSHQFGRIDCQSTSSNPFGRMDLAGAPSHSYMSDCPMTPSHPFGRSDCPPTPSHQFGRLDCPRTPSHPFGMSECPTTPSHPFGRVDGGGTPNYSFVNRTEKSQSIPMSQQYSKDPRLNRRSDSRSRRDEIDDRSYKDRGFNTGSSYQTQNRSFSRSESYTHHDKDDRGRSRSISRNERNFGYSRSRDNYFDQSNSTDRGDKYSYDNRSRYRERGTEDKYQRDKSVGRIKDSHETFVRSHSRARSIGRDDNKETENYNKLSVKSHAGRSFTIDTSVNATFQDLLKKKGLEIIDQPFDMRKQRAASVGRTVASCFIKDKISKNNFSDATVDDSEHRINSYRRASSVGRDLHNNHESFQKVKTDFKNYQRIAREEEKQRLAKITAADAKTRSKKYSENQNLKSPYSGTKTGKQAYSPRKNFRDPRMRRDYDDKYSHRSGHSYDKNKHGINYSSDNLAKGAVLGSGYGVKNYKIPKIKRPTNENQDADKLNNEKNIAVETKIKKDELKAIKKANKKHCSDGDQNVIEESPSKRLTRSSKKDKIERIEVPVKNDGVEIRKPKRAVIYDSSSDSESNNKDTVRTNKLTSDDEHSHTMKDSESSQNDQSTQEVKGKHNSDENEMFFDNVVSDPVVDNINALIADLDNHIDNSKTESSNFKDITFDDDLSNMSNLESICLSKENTFDALFSNEINDESKITDELENENCIKTNTDSCIDTSSKNMQTSLIAVNNKSPTALDDAKKTENIKMEAKEIVKTKSQLNDFQLPATNSESFIDEKNVASLKKSECNKEIINNDAIVSTTDNDKEMKNTSQEAVVKSTESNVNFETSAADSTNEVNSHRTKEHNVPDSTNDVNGEMNSLVSSSLSSSEVAMKDFVEPNLPQQAAVSPLDSIGSLLSILQDKSKIHQLLSMLGEHSGDNDKIKRKLEKLSEIVSDDEEGEPNKNVIQTSDLNVKDKDSTLEVNNIIDDQQVKTQIQLNDEAIDSMLKNTEQSEVHMVNAEKDDGEIVIEQPLIQNDNNEKVAIKKVRGPKKGKGKYTKGKKPQRVPRVAKGQVDKSSSVKKPSRELLKLREDIKEMFLTDEMLNSTGIRMCRLAKLVDEKSSNRKDEASQDPKPVVIIEKFKDQDKPEESTVDEKPIKKKTSPNTKRKLSTNEDEGKAVTTKLKTITKNVLGLKSKTKACSKQEDVDPYEFDTDSVGTNTIKGSDSEEVSDSETNSLISLNSFGSSEILADLQKKTKRRRRGYAWKTGIIKSKHKKKKQVKPTETSLEEVSPNIQNTKIIPDNECFTDKCYCFQKNVTSYPCRLCEFTGDDIILHYKNNHPHTEIPLSRMNPQTAKEAIEQCQEVNFPAISKISTDKYVCRFCFKEFSKSKTVLESFFWHIVSTHTGEYKQTCSQCANDACYFNLDMPPPPKNNTGQLIGYLCGKCNFTQVSLENLKTHVIGRHTDEQTDVYTINLAAMTRKTLKTLAKHQATIAARILRSSRSNQSNAESIVDNDEMEDNSSTIETVTQIENEIVTIKTEKKSCITPIQHKIAFESEENISVSDLGLNVHNNSVEIKQETLEAEDIEEPSQLSNHPEAEIPENYGMQVSTATEVSQQTLPDDVMPHAHFKICYKDSGAKEYVCCINGKDGHYKTTLLISMKKHIQSKHKERWDGYCVLCKVIVTPQGLHNFGLCLQHFLDKHMDEFPVLEIPAEVFNDASSTKNSSDVTAEVPKPYINVRPLNQLMSSPVETEITNGTNIQFPKIQSVVSLGANVDLPRSSPSYPPVLCTETPEDKQYRYEDWQAEIMSKKHRVVLNAMMSEEKLVKVFKCTGRFCSFASDNPENALLHATTHERIGGEGALNCAYCDFDASNNGIDLVMHVFKAHGKCPYTCKLCFYRATSSQLVSSHISRLHSERQSFDAILHATTIAVPVTDEANLMSREEAVPHYICGHPSPEGEAGACKFRTYTPGQFGEHLIRHQPPYPCSMCSISMSSASELVHHMKSHGLRLYQCTSCVCGADNEPEMLAHASARHPDRLPQAYLRVVTNKDGSGEFRVLPRAFLNKLKASSRDVTSADTDNPVREAERSIALEKLIGHTESVTSIEPIQSTHETSDDDMTADTEIVEDSELLLSENIEQEPEPPSLPPPGPASRRKSNPAGTAADIERKSLDENVSLVVKTEPEVKTPNISSDTVIYCLDSDEEDPRPRVIDISDDDIVTTPTASTSQEPREHQIIAANKLFRCPNCYGIARNVGGFKRHITRCLAKLLAFNNNIKCPHENCTVQLDCVANIANHYLKDHSESKDTIFVCGVCKAKFKSAALTKKHMKSIHKSSSFAVNSPEMIDGVSTVCIISERPQRAALRRKSSSETGKQKRYGPQDIDQLPINPILDSLVYCNLCEFNTKVRLNMVRHLQLHAEQQPVPQTAPVNPVPHLETNERHFDRMVNLASSSIVTRAPDKPARQDLSPAVDLGRYPKYVPDRQRYTCGTKNCSYISVDEGMLRIHWETLHSNTNDYLCVHCPPHQHLDQSKPLTAARIIGHLKMHEEDLYACSACSYYHFKRVAVEKHLQKCPQIHKERNIIVVREGGVTPSPISTTNTSAPTMDLKPWQCGLCSFKSMLRPEVTDHCFKIHQSKMQYKCNYCPFRTSAIENVTKHQMNAHPDKTEDVFYYYYREGSIPDVDGTPQWVIQKKNCGVTEPVVKAEIPEPSTSQPLLAPVTPPPVAVNLNLVKQEVEDTETMDDDESIEGLCKRFGAFCEPSGTKYKCPLCTGIVEDTTEAMQSHLYEELKYRKWGCNFCSYKAFHKTGLSEHIKSEHRRKCPEPIELPTDIKVEKWVAGLLEHQTTIIERNKKNIQDETPSTSKGVQDTELNLEELEKAFGSFGTPRDGMFCCPKCNCSMKSERAMKEHLESELTKIRWCCSKCSFKSHTYHEAQFHCASVHAGEGASPREAVRSAPVRAAWTRAVLRAQAAALADTAADTADNETADTARDADDADTADIAHADADNHADTLTDMHDSSDNSLLVVRYEERVPTPEDAVRRKRAAPVDSDDEKLVIDESEPVVKKKPSAQKACQYCDFKTAYPKMLRGHILRHYNLKPFKCGLCDFVGHRPTLVKHFEKTHSGRLCMEATQIPSEPPSKFELAKYNSKKTVTVDEDVHHICLHCGVSVLSKDLNAHKHRNYAAEFGKEGEVVVKCSTCQVLKLDVPSLQGHHKECHPDVPINYTHFKLHGSDSFEGFYCLHCNNLFTYLRDLRSHHRAVHSGVPLKYAMGPSQLSNAEGESSAKRKNDDDSIKPSPKRVAKKSTTKLPHNTVAKKSTTKLPHTVSDGNEEFSYYGTKPTSLENYANVTTLMPFCNTLVPFTVKKLSEIIKIEPVVLVNDD